MNRWMGSYLPVSLAAERRQQPQQAAWCDAETGSVGSALLAAVVMISSRRTR